MKMTMNFKYTVLLILISGLWSCETTEKIDDFPLRPSKMVVNSYLSPDTTWQFQVSKSLSVLDNAEIRMLDSAQIKIFHGNELLTTITDPDPDGWFRYPDHYPESGETYSIEVTSPYFEETLRAKETVPESIRPEEIRLIIKDSSFHEWTDYRDIRMVDGHIEATAEIQLSDPETEENYYELSMFTLDTIYLDEDSLSMEVHMDNIYLSSNDNSVEGDGDRGRHLLIKDDLFDGQTYRIKVDFSDWGIPRNQIYFIELKSLTRASYLYKLTNYAYQNAMNDPFAEPVQVFCNIENGYGIFAGFSSSYGFVQLN